MKPRVNTQTPYEFEWRQKKRISAIQGGKSGDEVLAAAAGMRVQDIAAAFGYMPGDMSSWLKANGYTISNDVLQPKNSFAVGAMRIPHDMPAQLHADEMVIPAYEAGFLRDRIEQADQRLFTEPDNQIGLQTLDVLRTLLNVVSEIRNNSHWAKVAVEAIASGAAIVATQEEAST